jgi:hypothetical protein
MLAVAIATVVALAAGVSVAGAVVGFSENYTYSDVSEFSDCGTTWTASESGSGHVLARVDKTGQAFLVKDAFRYRTVITNDETGKWFVIEGHGVFNEQRAAPADGTVYSYVFVEAGQPRTVRDAAGNIVLRDRGVTRVTYLFDTKGDGQPGGEYIEDVDVSFGGPHPTADAEFCSFAIPLTI